MVALVCKQADEIVEPTHFKEFFYLFFKSKDVLIFWLGMFIEFDIVFYCKYRIASLASFVYFRCGIRICVYFVACCMHAHDGSHENCLYRNNDLRENNPRNLSFVTKYQRYNIGSISMCFRSFSQSYLEYFPKMKNQI